MYSVLLVDDEYMILKGLEQIIDWEDEGFKIVNSVNDSKTALDYLSKNQVDLVITDVNMPELSGLDLINFAQKIKNSLEVIILSGYQEFDYVRRGLQLGASDYLLKPVDTEKLKNALRKCKASLDEKIKLNVNLNQAQNLLMNQLFTNELSIKQKENILEQFGLSVDVISHGLTMVACNELRQTEYIVEFCKENHQYLYYMDKKSVYIGFIGSKETLIKFVRTLEDKQYITGESYLTVGTIIYDWKDLQESFEQAKEISEVYKFYSNSDNFRNGKVRIDWLRQATVPKISLSSIHDSLFSGNNLLAIQSIKQIFEEFAVNNVSPSYARQVAFLIFQEINKLNNFNDLQYREFIAHINQLLKWQELEKLLIELVENMDGLSDKRSDISPVISRVLGIINEQFQQDINLSEIADELSLSANYLGQLFKRELEMSFSNYLNEFRINKAKKLLLFENDSSIADVAQQVGYINMGYFYRNFRKFTKISPKEFRRNKGN